jgi:hypothetical protein
MAKATMKAELTRMAFRNALDCKSELLDGVDLICRAVHKITLANKAFQWPESLVLVQLVPQRVIA